MGTWKSEKLGRLCSISIGGTPARVNPLYWDTAKTGRNLWASIKDLKNRFIEDTEERITDAGVRHSNAKLVKKGTVLMSFKLTIGRVAFAGKDLYTNEAIAAFETDQVDPYFLYCGLQHWNLLAGMDQAIKGATLNKAKLKEIEAHLPVLKTEQRQIAQVLSAMDGTIDQTEALIAKHQRIKTGLMQDLLTRGIDEHGRLRDPGTHKFKPSRLGPIPSEWDVKLLPEIAFHQNGKAFPSADFQDSGVPLLRPGNLQADGGLSWDNAHTVFLPDKWLAEASDFIVRDGELVMNLTAQSLEDEFLGRVCLTPQNTLCLLNQRLARFRARACHLAFLFWTLKGPHFRWQVDQVPQGTKVKHLYNSNLTNAYVAVPKDEREQKNIAQILFTATSALAAETRLLEKRRKLKSGLMQDLLTGKVSVEPLLEAQAVS
jgi:type I restriction enzyme S subunit